MKVIFNCTPLLWPASGTKTYVLNLLKAFNEGFSQVAFRLLVDREYGDPERNYKLHKISPANTSFKRKIFWEAASLPVTSLFLKGDVVHIPHHSTTLWTKQPSVMTIYDAIIWEDLLTISSRSTIHRSIGERLNVKLLKLAAQRANAIITVSEFSKSRLVELLGLEAQKIFVTPLAAGREFCALRESNTPRSPHLPIGSEKPYILYAGGNSMRKGVLQLLLAYDALRPEIRSAHDLVIVGDFSSNDENHKQIMALVNRSRLSGRIHMPGILTNTELAAAYRGATAFVFPSFFEGFGLTPLEAMSCGGAVIVSNNSSLPEVVGDAGLYFDPADPDSIAAAISRVLESQALREELQAKSRQRAAEFSWAKTAKLTLDVYKSAVS